MADLWLISRQLTTVCSGGNVLLVLRLTCLDSTLIENPVSRAKLIRTASNVGAAHDLEAMLLKLTIPMLRGMCSLWLVSLCTMLNVVKLPV